MIAALYVARGGAYWDQPGVDPWDEARDARTYAGPWPVVAHPPCQRWGRFWHGAPNKPHQFRLGDDGGCFAAALAAVRAWGGVLEHPADSRAWAAHGLTAPPRNCGWNAADFHGGWTCYVEQGHYGHTSRKATWLYAHGVELPSLIWGASPQRLSAAMVERYGYAKARRIGMVAMTGGKHKTDIRNATPPAFRDLLLSIARTARPALSLSFDGVSRAKRRAGLLLLALGVVMGAFQLHPGLNASATAQMDRMGASMSRWRGRGERLLEDLRVLRALAIGSLEGRTEELSQTLDEYVNSGNDGESSSPKNKPSPDAVLDSRDPKTTPSPQPLIGPRP